MNLEFERVGGDHRRYKVPDPSDAKQFKYLVLDGNGQMTLAHAGEFHQQAPPRPFEFCLEGVRVETRAACMVCGYKTFTNKDGKGTRLQHLQKCSGLQSMTMIEQFVQCGHLKLEARVQKLSAKRYFVVEPRQTPVYAEVLSEVEPEVRQFKNLVFGSAAPDCNTAASFEEKEMSKFMNDNGFVEFLSSATGKALADKYSPYTRSSGSADPESVEIEVLWRYINDWYQRYGSHYTTQTPALREQVLHAMGRTHGQWSLLYGDTKNTYLGFFCKMLHWLITTMPSEEYDECLTSPEQGSPAAEALEQLGILISEAVGARQDGMRRFGIREGWELARDAFDQHFAVFIDWLVTVQCPADAAPPFNKHFLDPVFVYLTMFHLRSGTNKLAVAEFHDWRPSLAMTTWTFVVVCYILQYTANMSTHKGVVDNNRVVLNYLKSLADGCQCVQLCLLLQAGAAKSQKERTGGTKLATHGNTVTVNGDAIDVAAVKVKVREYMNELRGSLWDSISYNYAATEAALEKYVAAAEDDHLETGHSLLTIKEPNWIDTMTQLYTKNHKDGPMSQAHVNAGVMAVDGDSTVVFRAKSAKKVLRAIKEWKSKLFVVLALTSGAPLRGSEWIQLSFFDTPTAERNVYVMEDETGHARVMIRTCYNKMQSRGEDSTNTRFLDEDVGQLLVCFLKFVYPFYILMRLAARPDLEQEAALTMSRKFFEWNGNTWTTSDLTRAVNSAGLRTYRVVRQFMVYVLERHICVGVGVKCLDPDEEDDQEFEDMMIDRAANHDTRTRRMHYGRDENLFQGDTRDKMTVLSRLSRRVARWGLECPNLAYEPDYLGELKSRPSFVPSNDYRAPFELVKDERKMQVCLQQEAACMFVARRPTENLLFVCPTGGGKSMTFQLPLLFDDSLALVVLVPLKAVKEGHIQSARKHKINVCADEFFLNKNYVSFLATLASIKSHVKLCLDEIHMLKSEASYRSFSNCKALATLANVSFLALTATMAQWTHEWVFGELFRAKQFEIIEQDVERVNLEYSIVDESTPFHSLMTDDNLGLDASGEVRKGLIFWKLPHSKINIQDSIDHLPEDLRRHCLFYFTPKRGDGVTDKQMAGRLKQFQEDPNIKYLFCTAALSAGVDLPNIGLVIHVGRPRGVTEWMQEAGRAGRWPTNPLRCYASESALAAACARNIVIPIGFEESIVDGDPDRWLQQDAAAMTSVIAAARRHSCIREATRKAWMFCVAKSCVNLDARTCGSCNTARLAQAPDLLVRQAVTKARQHIGEFKRCFDYVAYPCAACLEAHNPRECDKFKARYGQVLELVDYLFKEARYLVRNPEERCTQCERDEQECTFATSHDIGAAVVNILIKSGSDYPILCGFTTVKRDGVALPDVYFEVAKLAK